MKQTQSITKKHKHKGIMEEMEMAKKTVQVVSKQNRGPVIIKINDTRLVLGRGMSEKILVSLKHCELNFDDTHR